MAKKAKGTGFSFRLVILMAVVILAGIGSVMYFYPNAKDTILQYIENEEILTLEARYTPEQLLEAHRQELIGNEKRVFQEPLIKYIPYLLLEVKYAEDHKSHETFILWGLEDGEMVLSTEPWETTHGFKDCLDCHASRSDFKILQALARHPNPLAFENLQKDLQLEKEMLGEWLESAKNKHLIVQKGTSFQLHFENPKILIAPQTKIPQHFVSKPIAYHQRSSKVYSRNQVVRLAHAAFGEDFTIRNEKEVFIPVYTLTISNSDGSTYTSDWNAVTGQRVSSQFY